MVTHFVKVNGIPELSDFSYFGSQLDALMRHNLRTLTRIWKFSLV